MSFTTQNLKEGMIVANYFKMCELVGEEPKSGGKSRALQLERWKKYIDWEKKGHKFHILKIRETPLPKKISKNDIYTQDILTIVAYDLLQKQLNSQKMFSELSLTNKQLLLKCGFVNSNYSNDVSKTLQNLSYDNNCSEKQIEYHYNKLYEHIKSEGFRAIKNSLNRLNERGILIVDHIYMVKYEGDEEYRIANETEERKIAEIEKRIKAELNISIVNFYNEKKYNKKLNQKLFEEEGITGCYKIYNISLGRKAEIKEISENDVEIAKKSINKNFLNRMYQCVEIDMTKYIVKDLSSKHNIEVSREIAEAFELVDLGKHFNKESKLNHYEYTKMLKESLVDFYVKTYI